MFNKIFLASLLALTLSHATDDFSSERLLGIEVGYGNVNTTTGGVSNTYKDPEYGFRIGAQNEEWRTTFSANFMKTEVIDYKKFMLQFDRFVWASLYKTDNIVFKPYLGAHIGWMGYTDDFAIEDNGLVYGGQAGIAWNVLNEVDFDLGYRYSVTNMDVVDNIGSITFGMNYIY